MTAKLSVNINKIATLRNSRGTGYPSLNWAIDTIAQAGAVGVTIHPREDERHITRSDIFSVAEYIRKEHPHLELNIEGDVRDQLIADILEVRPTQATLVPVRPGELTSDHGFDFDNLPDGTSDVLAKLKGAGIRTAMFVDADPEAMAKAKAAGTDRIEIYTGPYAHSFDEPADKKRWLERITATVKAAKAVGLGINAGHDLDTNNLPPLVAAVDIDEVSIGHMLTVRALAIGFGPAIKEFKAALEPA